MKSKVIKAIIAGIIAIGVIFGGYSGYNALTAKKTVATSVQYMTATARKMNMEVNIQGTGTAYAAVTKDISASNNGTLKDLAVKVGDTVTAGQKLFTSDSDDVRKTVTTAQNNLTKQNLTLTNDQNAQQVDDNKVAMDKLSVSDAQTQLNTAYQQLNNMTVKAPIGGIVTAVNNSNGDSVQSGKAVLTIVDMSSLKIKVSVDELDIDKVKIGQSAQIKFDAVKDKSFEGSVESIAQTGTTSNNVTTYDVVVAIKDPTGIKLGMNANVNILVESKENALVIPSEALIEKNNKKYVMVESTDSGTTNTNTSNQTLQNSSQSSQGGSNTQKANSTTSSSGGKLVEVKIGIQNENYIEVTEGITEGQKLLIKVTSTSSTTNSNKNNMNGFGGFDGGMQGGPQGDRPQGSAPQGNSSGAAQQGGK